MMLLVVLLGSILQAQINAVTESGDEVILYPDGTWKYKNKPNKERKEIPLNPEKFLKDPMATFLVKSQKVNIGIWIDPKLWKFKKGQVHEAAEFQFKRQDFDLYGMLISEKIEIPIPALKEVALENAMEVAPDVKVDREEYRIVNGIKVLMMQMSGTIKGGKFTYYGYYYSSKSGTIQFLTYTAQNLFQDYFGDIERFLNGLVLQN